MSKRSFEDLIGRHIRFDDGLVHRIDDAYANTAGMTNLYTEGWIDTNCLPHDGPGGELSDFFNMLTACELFVRHGSLTATEQPLTCFGCLLVDR